MLDIAYIKDHAAAVRKAAHNKNVAVDIDRLLELDHERREIQQAVDTVQGERNALAQSVSGKPDEETLRRGRELKEKAQALGAQQDQVLGEYQQLLLMVPNIPSQDTPIGADESDNVILRQAGNPPTFDFEPKEFWELGPRLGVLDTERAAEVAGARFAYLKGGLVQLQFALVQLALSVLTDAKALQAIITRSGLDVPATPFVPVLPPVMVRPAVMQDMARLEPREERYHLPGDDLYLVGSAEHTLGPLHRGETLAAEQLPIRYVGYSTSFRREAGSYGKDLKGVLRLHHFDKLEIESFSLPEQSMIEQDFIVAIQEYLMQELGLAYQVVLKCTGDMGGPDHRAIDIEAWLPGQNQYRETHTADLMTDYQARRLGTKVRQADGAKVFVHMNDATVFAMGRTLTAIAENYQQADGSVVVPDALRQYVPFEKIEVKK